MKQNEFVASAANLAFFVNDQLAFTGTANLNSTVTVAMQETNVNAGQGNMLLFSYKHSREMTVAATAADWKLEYLASQAGTAVSQGLKDFYKINECITLTGGVGTLSEVPLGGKVGVELPSGSVVTVVPTSSTINLSSYGLTTESVKVTYRYSTTAKSVVIDASSTPLTGKLILSAGKYQSNRGKTGNIEIIIPAFQLSGNFEIALTPDSVVSTNLEGRSLAVYGDTCESGAPVYAYINEEDSTEALAVSEISAAPSFVTVGVGDTQTLTVLGLNGELYRPVALSNSDCTFTSDTPGKATVNSSGVITGVATGTALVTVEYEGLEDVVSVTIEA
jgi:hypothetical protein